MGECFHLFYAHIFDFMGRRGWLTPMGPPLWGAYWLPFLLVGLMVALLLAAAPLGRKRKSTVELVDGKKEEKEQKAALMLMGTFFRVLVLALITVLYFRYI